MNNTLNDHSGLSTRRRKPPSGSPDDLARRLAEACTAGELTTPASRELCALALRVAELELENAALRGTVDGLKSRLSCALLSQVAAVE